MSRLLSAGFDRLFHSLCFKIYIIFAAAYSLCGVFTRYIEIQNMRGFDNSIAVGQYNNDNSLFDCAMTLTFAAAVFTAMFIGREYSDGTLRNKLTVGHSRGTLYLSELIVCTAANITGSAVSLAITAGLSLPLMGTDFSASEIAVFTFTVIIAGAAMTAVFLSAAMLLGSRSATTAALIIGTFVMLILTSYIDERLAAEEYLYSYQSFYGSDREIVLRGGISEEEEAEAPENSIVKIKNPLYLNEGERKVYEFLKDFLPFSQLYRTANSNSVDLTKTVIYDIIILIAVTEAGVLLFCKKDIK